MTEKQKMLAGELYSATDPQLHVELKRARRLCRLFNATSEQQRERRGEILRELFGEIGDGFEIEPPFFCDYGSNIRAGEKFYANVNCVILDCAAVTIGDGVYFGPGVHVYAARHPVDPAVRRTRAEVASPVSIGNNVWIGGGAIFCPGVSIGDDTTIGAGSVVVSDIPPAVVAAGNPCRVIRRLDGE